MGVGGPTTAGQRPAASSNPPSGSAAATIARAMYYSRRNSTSPRRTSPASRRCGGRARAATAATATAAITAHGPLSLPVSDANDRVGSLRRSGGGAERQRVVRRGAGVGDAARGPRASRTRSPRPPPTFRSSRRTTSPGRSRSRRRSTWRPPWCVEVESLRGRGRAWPGHREVREGARA